MVISHSDICLPEQLSELLVISPDGLDMIGSNDKTGIMRVQTYRTNGLFKRPIAAESLI